MDYRDYVYVFSSKILSYYILLLFPVIIYDSLASRSSRPHLCAGLVELLGVAVRHHLCDRLVVVHFRLQSTSWLDPLHHRIHFGAIFKDLPGTVNEP